MLVCILLGSKLVTMHRKGMIVTLFHQLHTLLCIVTKVGYTHPPMDIHLITRREEQMYEMCLITRTCMSTVYNSPPLYDTSFASPTCDYCGKLLHPVMTSSLFSHYNNHSLISFISFHVFHVVQRYIIDDSYYMAITVDPQLSEQQWPEDSKNHADK